jgi:hypothetical protein
MALFERYVGIDYSGAQTAESSLSGLRLFVGTSNEAPREELPPRSPKKFWTRRGIAEWLCARLSEGVPTLVGIDHAFSFPIAYFDKCRLTHEWHEFLDDFQRHWPTDAPATYVEFVRDGACGSGNERKGDPSWLRLTERWTATAKSVFLFDVQGSVAKSTHAGLPWLRYLRNECNPKPHFWPFDGWQVPSGSSVIAEVYPSLWMKRFAREKRDGDQHAAFSAAGWLQRADRDGSLPIFLDPPLRLEERKMANIEGWILGVV